MEVSVPKSSTKYSYKWVLIEYTPGYENESTVVLKDTDKNVLKIIDLKEGSYKFKVIVTGSQNSIGEAIGILKVLPGEK